MALEPHSIEAISADDFIADTIDPDPSEAVPALRRMRERFRSPVLDEPALIRKSEAQDLLQVVSLMNRYRSLPLTLPTRNVASSPEFATTSQG